MLCTSFLRALLVYRPWVVTTKEVKCTDDNEGALMFAKDDGGQWKYNEDTDRVPLPPPARSRAPCMLDAFSGKRSSATLISMLTCAQKLMVVLHDSKGLLICSGAKAGWNPVSPPTLGKAPASPGPSCSGIKKAGLSSGSGLYWLAAVEGKRKKRCVTYKDPRTNFHLI